MLRGKKQCSTERYVSSHLEVEQYYALVKHVCGILFVWGGRKTSKPSIIASFKQICVRQKYTYEYYTRLHKYMRQVGRRNLFSMCILIEFSVQTACINVWVCVCACVCAHACLHHNLCKHTFLWVISFLSQDEIRPLKTFSRNSNLQVQHIF